MSSGMVQRKFHHDYIANANPNQREDTLLCVCLRWALRCFGLDPGFLKSDLQLPGPGTRYERPARVPPVELHRCHDRLRRLSLLHAEDDATKADRGLTRSDAPRHSLF